MNVILQNLYISRELNASLFHPVCLKYDLTLAEIVVLLFLADNSEYDTAKDIVEKLKIAKSHVSYSVKNLEKRGFLTGRYEKDNHRTIHLQLCDSAVAVIDDARKIQRQFISALGEEFSQEELDEFKAYLQRVTKNINLYLKNSLSI